MLQLLNDPTARASEAMTGPLGVSDADLLDAYSSVVVRAVERVGPSVAHLAVWTEPRRGPRRPFIL